MNHFFFNFQLCTSNKRLRSIVFKLVSTNNLKCIVAIVLSYNYSCFFALSFSFSCFSFLLYLTLCCRARIYFLYVWIISKLLGRRQQAAKLTRKILILCLCCRIVWMSLLWCKMDFSLFPWNEEFFNFRFKGIASQKQHQST